MKNLISAVLLLTVLVSCGSADGTSDDTDGLALSNHRIFVTSTSYQGKFGDTAAEALINADAKCVEVAKSVGLVRNYQAILSTNAQPASRFNFTGSIYIFTSSSEKLLVVASEADLWGSGSKFFLNKINIDEKYASVSGARVWTGTNSDGGAANDNCSNWTKSDTGFSSWYGNSDKLNTEWTETGIETCDKSYRIYCVSQPKQ